jgi:transglutaminase-like putative cysteine protease
MNVTTRYRVRHLTEYSYGSDVVHSHQLLHLVPRPLNYQQCFEHSIEITPGAYRRGDEVDAFGNPVTRIEIQYPHRHLEVAAQMEVTVHPRPPVHAVDTLPWDRVASTLSYHSRALARDALEASRFRHESPYVRVKKLFTDYAQDCFAPGRPILEGAEDLMRKLNLGFEYAPGETTIATPVTEVLQNRRGVCQDFAHLMISCLRSRGLAARYVSGYVRTCGPRDTKAQLQLQFEPEQVTVPATSGPDSDEAPALLGGAASHAWVSVFCPPFGWIDLDPTNDTYVGTDHVAIAWGRDFGDVSPLRGVILGGGTHRLSVHVAVEPLDE